MKRSLQGQRRASRSGGDISMETLCAYERTAQRAVLDADGDPLTARLLKRTGAIARRARKNPRNDCEYRRMVGKLFLHAGNYKDAEKEYAKALKTAPADDPRYRNIVAYEYALARKMTVVPSKPLSMIVSLTNRCNLRCRMCDQYRRPSELPMRTIREIEKLFPVLNEVAWMGGEVFLVKHFEPLFLCAAVHKNLRQIILTNGLLINDRWARLLAGTNTTVRFSIDSVTKKTYESIRRGGRFEDLMRSIRNLNRHRRDGGFRAEMCFLVMKSNYREIERAVEFAAKHRFQSITFNAAEGSGPRKSIFEDPDGRIRAYFRALYPRLRRKADAFGLELHYHLPRYAAGEAAAGPVTQPPRRPPREMFCRFPWRHLRIFENKARFDCYCSVEIGDVEKNTLEEIWNGKAAQQYRKNVVQGCTGWCSRGCLEGLVPHIRHL